jgi:hypothetical protein
VAIWIGRGSLVRGCVTPLGGRAAVKIILYHSHHDISAAHALSLQPKAQFAVRMCKGRRMLVLS